MTLSEVTAHRRYLHQIPELDANPAQTLALISGVLRGHRCEYFFPTEGGLCVWFDFGKPETVAFRADLDASPVQEATGVDYSSRNPGRAHVRGHDGHAAMALSLAQWISRISTRKVSREISGESGDYVISWEAREKDFPRNILILFQPPKAAGGAEALCRTGILERYRVTRIFALRIWPGVPEGVIASRPGAFMARSNDIDIKITGQSARISYTDKKRDKNQDNNQDKKRDKNYGAGFDASQDALLTGAEFLRRAQIMADNAPPPCVLKFGVMRSGGDRNFISGETILQGGLRTYQETTYQYCRESLIQISGELSRETGCQISVSMSDGWDAVWNHEKLYKNILNNLNKNNKIKLLKLKNPVLASEDFSFYQNRTPGVLFFLGVGDAPELYSPAFDFHDELVLPKGLEFLQNLALLN